MPIADFVHLRVHTAYSLSEGAIKIKELVGLCKSMAMPAVAITDTGNLFGALEFASAAKDAGVQPIIGTILSLSRPPAEHGPRGVIGLPAQPDVIVLLAQDERGYENLMDLVSRSFLETDQGHAPQLPLAAFEGSTDGLIALTGGPAGPVGRLLLEGQAHAADVALGRLAALFPGRLYVEVMRHGLEEEERIEPALIDLAYKHDLPLVATNDCFFSTEDMYEAHDALLCIAEGTYVVAQDRRRLTPEHRFRTAAEMRTLFADLPEAVDNTLVIARRCAVMPKKRDPILPTFAVEGRTEAEEMRIQSHEGLEQRLRTVVFTEGMGDAERAEIGERYRTRLDYELGVIETMGFPGYFLIVADFIKWAKAQGIPVGPGRGSGAGSVVAWSLTITDLDPLQFGLLFERFLNPERVSMPDFDIDFCQDRRDEVIDYVRDKYGHDRVAQIITFGKLQARAVLRDVGRVLQMPYGQVDRICKLVPNNPANPVTLQQAIDGEPQLKAERDGDASVARLIEIALKLEGLYRHASTHAAGVVIGDRPLKKLVPLYRDPRSPIPATQFNMKYVELAGLVKFDFLGLKTLTVLQTAEELLRAGGHDDIDLARIPLDDPTTYAMLGRAEATGVFQLESSGMRDVLRRMKPSRIGDIIALVALYRPGPMDNIPTFIEVKNGQKAPDYLYPTLKPILEETYGIMVYQEQVMQVAQVLAGYTLGGADLLRRAMGKKIKSEMDAQKKNFVDGAVARGVPEGQAANIFDQVEKFAGYGFNKSHAAAYAIVAYQTAWLKANWPVEFFAASMTLDLGNTDKLNIFKQELDRLHIRLLPPDVNRSSAVFGVERLPDGGKAIRYALGAVKGVGLEAMRDLVRARGEGGPFRDAFDFARRIDPRQMNRRQIENLIKAGAFDGLERNRARMMASVDTLVRYAQGQAADRVSGQVSLFGATAFGTPQLPTMPEWESMEKLRQEFEAVGFYLSAHPLDGYNVRRLGVARSSEILGRAGAGATEMRLAGVVMAKREMTTKTGNRMAFVTLSDASGVYEVTLFAELLPTARPLLEVGTALVMGVEIQKRGDEVRLTVTALEPLDQAITRTAARFQIFVDGPQAVGPLHALLDREGPGRNKITLLVQVEPTREVEIDLPGAWALSGKARGAFKSLPGIVAVEEI